MVSWNREAHTAEVSLEYSVLRVTIKKASNISLISYIGQSLYPHIYWVCSGVNLDDCLPSFSSYRQQYSNKVWLYIQASIYSISQCLIFITIL